MNRSIDSGTADPAAPCVVVVGMHRSGTSATTGALRLFGLGMPRGDDLVAAGHGNPKGHFESRSLTAFDDRLLDRVGGSWDRPPILDPDWERSSGLAEERRLAPSTFRVVFGDSAEPVAWKDPRLSLLLPFWRAVLDRRLVAILACRDPFQTAASLAARDGSRLTLGLALWDRYQRQALESLRGLPVFVTHFERALAERGAWTDALASFLRESGVKISDPSPDEMAEWLDPTLRRERSRDDPASKLLPAQVELAEVLERIAGPHECFEPPELSPPDGWVTELLEARADSATTWRGLIWAAEALSRRSAGTVRQLLGLREESAGTAGAPEDYPLNATQNRKAYRAWLAIKGRPAVLPGQTEIISNPVRLVARTEPPGEGPRFSVVVPVYKPLIWALNRCIASVLDQSEGSFEVCLCDDGSGDHAVTAALEHAARADRRVKITSLEQNSGISAATNGALALASGEFVVFLDQDDELTPYALAAVAEAIDRDGEADVIYSDEDKIDIEGVLSAPQFKPDWSPDTLLSCAYLCHLLVVRTSLVRELGGMRSELDGSQDYDLMLRASERARSVVHVPDVLYHWRILAGSAASGNATVKTWAYEAGKRAIEDALRRRGEEATVDADTVVLGTYHVRREIVGNPRVSVIVPFRDEPALLTQVVESVREAPGYDNFELVLVDNGSVLAETAALLDQLAQEPDVLLLEEPGPFNWSAINNAAARESSGDLLLFMNNDVEATGCGWMRAMVEQAQRDEIGAVGARLLYPNRTVQHVGVILGVGGAAAHVLCDLPESLPGYLTWAYMIRNCIAVTGACLMTRRDVFEELGGFSEDLPVAFNDVDYCLRLHEGGRRVVFTPLAELVHHESRTRGHTDDAVELPRFLRRWSDRIRRGDPYYHRELCHWSQYCSIATPEEEQKWKNFLSSLEHLPQR